MPSHIAMDLQSPLNGADELIARVERIVRCRTGGRIRDLRVEVQRGEVILSGVTSTYYAKQLATHAALDELSEQRLTNDINVL